MAACKEWDLEPDNTIVVLDGGKSESDLMALMDRCVGWCSPDWQGNILLNDDEYIPFAEPDLDGEHTGFAIKPGRAPSWVLSLPLLRGGDKND